MNNEITADLLNICRILGKHQVQYLIVGGIAVGFHGFIRISTTSSGQPAEKQDFDLWYNPTYENYFRLLDALEDLGQDVQEFKNERTPQPLRSFFKFNCPNFTVDFLPEIIGFKRFSEVTNSIELVRIDNISIPIIG